MPLARQCIGLRPAQQQGTAADSREDQSAAAQSDQGTFPITASPSWCGSITIRKTHHVMSAVTSNFQGIQQSTYQLPAKTKDPLKMILLRIIIAIHDNLIFLGTVSKI